MNVITISAFAALAMSGCVEISGDQILVHPDGDGGHDVLMTGVWVSGNVDETYAADRTYNHIQETFIHSGTIMGDGVTSRDASGRTIDSGMARYSDGQLVLHRTLAGDAGGDGRLSCTGCQGTATALVEGYGTGSPGAVFSLAWSGNRVETPVYAESTFGFYVPEGTGKILVQMVYSGSYTLGATVVDPAGNEQVAIAAGDGTEVSSEPIDATSGYWSLRMEGPSNGQFVVSVLPTGSDGPRIKIDL